MGKQQCRQTQTDVDDLLSEVVTFLSVLLFVHFKGRLNSSRVVLYMSQFKIVLILVIRNLCVAPVKPAFSPN